ncbi:OV-16 antigen [Trichonephila inaurata madagascariensis]|uniref:OV-16 antigen n=1 Tax=Trichonephila inaurata madagascariensis TaxID=2747483 RepID=A0A8X7CPF4_9ARAC|nr:OV-16 antigen [Trichonephila inaurata madagascariensis]
MPDVLPHNSQVTTFAHIVTCEQGCCPLQHRTFSRKEGLKHRVKMISENASMMVTCDHPTQYNESTQAMGSNCAPLYYSTPSIFLYADAPNPENPHLANYRNWVVEDIPGNDIYKGYSVSTYKPPDPPLNSSAHRYIFLVYQQPTSKKLQETMDDDLRAHFKVKTFVHKRNLIGPLAGNFMYVRHL